MNRRCLLFGANVVAAMFFFLVFAASCSGGWIKSSSGPIYSLTEVDPVFTDWKNSNTIELLNIRYDPTNAMLRANSTVMSADDDGEIMQKSLTLYDYLYHKSSTVWGAIGYAVPSVNISNKSLYSHNATPAPFPVYWGEKQTIHWASSKDGSGYDHSVWIQGQYVDLEATNGTRFWGANGLSGFDQYSRPFFSALPSCLSVGTNNGTHPISWNGITKTNWADIFRGLTTNVPVGSFTFYFGAGLLTNITTP